MSNSIGDILRKPKKTEVKQDKEADSDKDDKKAPRGNALLSFIAEHKKPSKEK